jgi:acyl-CoA synthetase (NDP forming)
VYPFFASLPGPVDLALTIIPAEAVVDSLAEGLANGLKAGLVHAARFGEGGDLPGEERARTLRALCDDGLRICGPNCMGSISLPENLLFYPASRVRGLPPGSVGVVFQSGGGPFRTGSSKVRCAGSGFPMRCRAATSWISMSQTTFPSWSMIWARG